MTNRQALNEMSRHGIGNHHDIKNNRRYHDIMKINESTIEDAIKKSGIATVKTRDGDAITWRDAGDRVVARFHRDGTRDAVVMRADVMPFIDGVENARVNHETGCMDDMNGEGKKNGQPEPDRPRYKHVECKPGMIVRIAKDCRSIFRRLFHGGDLTGKAAIICRVEMFIVGDGKNAEVFSLDYPVMTVGRHDIGGMECWWEPTGKVVERGDDVMVMLESMNEKVTNDGENKR
jgi:hypothetical protein